VKALKDFPDVWDELRGAHLLEWLDGRGAVHLYAIEGRAMLLEHAGRRHLSSVIHEEGDPHATDIAAQVLARITAPDDRDVPPALQHLRDRFRGLFAKADAMADTGSSYVDAARLATDLLAKTVRTVPLHGDLHHDNIIHGRRGWLAIDPKGVLGDPAFDAANLFYNPLERDDLCLDENRIAHMSDVFARALDTDPRHILNHAVAYGHLSAAWHAEDGNVVEEARELSIAKRVIEVALRL
jgi:streptomycin 6-kinase